MAVNDTANATNETVGGAAPPAGGQSGIPGLDVASRQLNRVRDMLQERLGDLGGWADGIGEALRNMGGGGGEAPGMLVPPDAVTGAADAVSHLPEVLL